MATSVLIPAAVIENHLKLKGFVRGPNCGNEVVYEFTHRADPTLVLRVFTSIREGAQTTRDAGEDAIRVALVWRANGRSAGLMKTTRVNRVTSVQSTLDRLGSRLREVYKEATSLRYKARCSRCGCPVWSDSNRCRNQACAGKHDPKAGRVVLVQQSNVQPDPVLYMTQPNVVVAAPVDDSAERARLAAIEEQAMIHAQEDFIF